MNDRLVRALAVIVVTALTTVLVTTAPIVVSQAIPYITFGLDRGIRILRMEVVVLSIATVLFLVGRQLRPANERGD